MKKPAQLFSLEDRTALIFGGTGELCGAMAEGLAAAGAHCVLVGRNADKAAERIARIESAGGKASFASCDVSDRSAVAALIEEQAGVHGGIDILINGAGVNSPTPFLEITEEEFDRIFDINLKAVFFACQAFGEYALKAKRNGSIINVGSVSGILPLSRVFTYSASKGALHNLTRNLAREWATAGIRVNTIVPGFFPAEQNRKILTEERVGQIMGHTPMRRFGESSELVGATLLLASDAGSFITGHELAVDGGFTSMTI